MLPQHRAGELWFRFVTLFMNDGGSTETTATDRRDMAERVGFEPTEVQAPHLISSQARSASSGTSPRALIRLASSGDGGIFADIVILWKLHFTRIGASY